MHERLVLCGHQVHKIRVRGERLYLKLTGKDLRHADDDSNVSLKISDISRKLLTEVPDPLTDLLEIAAYVLAADAATDRGDPSLPQMGDDWRRRFRFVIPVRRPDVWAARELMTLLSETLGFLSEDEYRFEFVALQDPVGFDSYLDLRSPVRDPEPADEVVLFSGGLDSLGGAVDDLLGARKRVVLVSHHSSSKLAARQRALASALEQRARDRVLHVPVRMNKRGDLTVEYSQRSRSFFFVALGTVVARIVGTNRIRLYENGIVSVNLPIAENVIGARATRSTHPSVIAAMNQLLGSLFESTITVENPYALLTKAEVVERIAAQGCADLIPQTVSCSRVYQIETERPHCGECTQCLGRRFAVLSAGLEQQDPEHGYRVRLFVGDCNPAILRCCGLRDVTFGCRRWHRQGTGFRQNRPHLTVIRLVRSRGGFGEHWMSNSPAGVGRLSEAVAQPYERCRPLTTTHLSQRVLAERWDISPRTLERWRWVGQGPKFLKLGGRVVYRLQDVEDYELEQLRSSTTA